MLLLGFAMVDSRFGRTDARLGFCHVVSRVVLL
jgi:hypothetical protein